MHILVLVVARVCDLVCKTGLTNVLYSKQELPEDVSLPYLKQIIFMVVRRFPFCMQDEVLATAYRSVILSNRYRYQRPSCKIRFWKFR